MTAPPTATAGVRQSTSVVPKLFRANNIFALALFAVSYLLGWFGLVLLARGKDRGNESVWKFNTSEWIGLVFAVVMALLVWGRDIFVLQATN